MNYTVTIVFHAYTGTTHVVEGHRAAVTHLLGDKLIGKYPLMRIDGDGQLFMPIKPRSMKSLHAYFDLDDARLAEAQAIDEAMRSKSDGGAT